MTDSVIIDGFNIKIKQVLSGFVILENNVSLQNLISFSESNGTAIYIPMSLGYHYDEVVTSSAKHSVFGLIRCLNQMVYIDTIKKIPEIVSPDNFWVIAPNGFYFAKVEFAENHEFGMGKYDYLDGKSYEYCHSLRSKIPHPPTVPVVWPYKKPN